MSAVFIFLVLELGLRATASSWEGQTIRSMLKVFILKVSVNYK